MAAQANECLEQSSHGSKYQRDLGVQESLFIRNDPTPLRLYDLKSLLNDTDF